MTALPRWNWTDQGWVADPAGEMVKYEDVASGEASTWPADVAGAPAWKVALWRGIHKWAKCFDDKFPRKKLGGVAACNAVVEIESVIETVQAGETARQIELLEEITKNFEVNLATIPTEFDEMQEGFGLASSSVFAKLAELRRRS